MAVFRHGTAGKLHTTILHDRSFAREEIGDENYSNYLAKDTTLTPIGYWPARAGVP